MDDEQPRNLDSPFDLREPAAPAHVPPTQFVPVARPWTWSHPILLRDSGRLGSLVDLIIGVVVIVLSWFVADLIVVIAFLGLPALRELMQGGEVPGLERAVLLPLLSARAALTSLIICGVLYVRGQSLGAVGLSLRRFGVNCLVGFALLVPVFLMVRVVNSVVIFYPELLESPDENSERLLELIPILPYWQYLPMAILISFYEEFLFRGFVLPRLRRVFGGWAWAIVVSSILFGLLHLFEQTVLAAVMITLLSVALSLVTAWRRSIVPAIVAHGVFNFVMLAGLRLIAG